MTSDTIANSKMLLTNKNSESFYLGSPKHVKSTNKGYSVRWAVASSPPIQTYPYDRAVLFDGSGTLITSVRIVPTIIPDNIKEITLTLNS
jgi:hypothetical protein